MPNNTIKKIDEALATLATEKSIEAGLSLASFLLQHMSTAGIKSTDSNSADFILLTALKLPNAERYDHWFQAHPKFKSDRACFVLNDIKQGPIEAKLYALKTKKKLYISGAAHFTPNFEDALFTRQDPNAKVGIDFFLPPSNDALLVVVSNNKSLRVVELKDRLTNTQKDIFAKWSNVANLEREQLHLTIWDSFKLKSINEAFYKGIANSFKDLVSHLEGVGKSSNEARHFANRLHGRLLFCWFLDKKGFINREVNYFDTTHTDATQYYKDKLELLFFDTLNTPQNERETSHPDQKTPYLNGGLFEAQPDDWPGSNVPFPQGFFVRLYEHFGEFNFTTDESTPDYEQIAIDPEMLGKIFENLLAEINEDTGEQARKAKGAFYTPREIVAYMCRESVREYLYTATNAGEKAKISIDKLLDTSDSDWAKSGTNSRRDTGEAALREKIIEALDEMKVLDPACGSGAFPIGMLHLLVQLYERLDGRFDAYKTKLGIMERNIYGVDIEPLAIEIARLRSFLALVVDQEYVEKKPNGGIDTLPNLEFKFVCANTLIPLTRQSSLGDSGKYETLLEIKKEYFKADPKKREKLETKYSALRQQGTMFDSRLNEQLQTYDPFNNDHPASFYDQHLMHDITDAFDVVIGNPPYVGEKGHKHIFRPIASSEIGLRFYMRKMDLFYFFFHKGLDLLNDKGLLTYITTNYYVTADGAQKLRNDMKFRTTVLSVVNFGEFKIFDSAKGQHNLITLLKKGTSDDLVKTAITRRVGSDNSNHLSSILSGNDSLTNYYTLTQDELHSHNQLRLTSGNLDELLNKIAKRSVKLSEVSKINMGVQTAADFVNPRLYKIAIDKNLDIQLGEGVYVVDKDNANIFPEHERTDLLKKYIKNSDIKKYHVDLRNHKYLIYTDSTVDINKYPSIKEHLFKYKELLLEREQAASADGWFWIRGAKRKFLVNTGKHIVCPYRSKTNIFALTDGSTYGAGDVYFITQPTQNYSINLLLGILNSRLIFCWLFNRGKRKGLTLELYQTPLSNIPIFEFNSDHKIICSKIEEIVQHIHNKKSENASADTSVLESQIDDLVYQLYGLSPEEINLIES